MTQQQKCDWTPGSREVGKITPPEECQWQETLVPSCDGEKFAAVVARDDGTFTLRVNDSLWDMEAEKITFARFVPDGRVSAIVRVDGEWAAAVDGELQEERYDYLWGTLVSKNNSRIAMPFQRDMEYGVLLEKTPWETLFGSATDFVISDSGMYTCAVVRTAPLGQADLEGFAKGIYTIAVDGTAWEQTFLNAWSPCFDAEEHRVACTVRVTPFEYSIAVNGQRWNETFPCAWEPCFDETGACLAPVRKSGGWGLARNGSMLWKPSFAECWTPVARAGAVWAVVAPRYGAFTVACNGVPWRCLFPVVTDLVVSPDGKRAAALASHDNSLFRILADGKPWEGEYDMAWPPFFSPDGCHIAAHVRKGGKEAIVLDGKVAAEGLDQTWNPVFSPDGKALMFCAVRGDTFLRHVINTEN